MRTLNLQFLSSATFVCGLAFAITSSTNALRMTVMPAVGNGWKVSHSPF